MRWHKYVVMGLTLLFTSSLRAEQVPDDLKLIPSDAVVVLRIVQPRALIERGFDEQVVELVKSMPQVQEALENPETQQALEMVRFFETKHDTRLPELLGRLTGGGITLAVVPNGQALLIVEAEDGDLLEETHEFFRTIAKAEAVKQGEPDRVASGEYRGLTGWTFGKDETHAIVDNHLLLSKKPEVLKAAVDRYLDGGTSHSGMQNLTEAQKVVDGDAQITLYADMRLLKELPDFQKALTENANPLSQLLLAPLLAGAEQANWIMASAKVTEDDVKFAVVADNAGDQVRERSGFALPGSADDGAMPLLNVPRQIASMSFYRDLHEFYASKDKLFGERTSGLIFFENMMGIFFPGKDFTGEVLAKTLPDVRFVVAEQEYDETTGTPAMQLPGFAAVFKMRDPQTTHLMVEEAWQKAIGLLNFTRGQQALPGLIIDRDIYRESKYTRSGFSIADEPSLDAVDIRFNFQPALAAQGDYLIMSSTDALARDLMDALHKQSENKAEPVGGEHTLFELYGCHWPQSYRRTAGHSFDRAWWRRD